MRGEGRDRSERVGGRYRGEGETEMGMKGKWEERGEDRKGGRVRRWGERKVIGRRVVKSEGRMGAACGEEGEQKIEEEGREKSERREKIIDKGKAKKLSRVTE